MEIKVLGPLEGGARGVSVIPSASKPRQILALLAVNAGQMIPVPTLMEEIWGEAMPRSALTTLQTYILQLRRLITAALGPCAPHAAKDVLATRHGGYLLRVPQDAVDVHAYERLAGQGRAAADRGADEEAARLYREALRVWRGPAFVDVRTGPLLEIELVRLEESRLGILERRIDADLRLGRHAELISELTTLVARHPLHEALHAQCMVALYRAGRQWQALETYQHLRKGLAAELGLDPSPRLRRLQQAILGGDPALDAGTRRGAALDMYAA
ncbi:hypothetical protein DMA15_22880 [Streptomyces sp. WAC 01529]|uniref:AfsR/SARP family transcriptional regulator n=1 Tax=Streptomyces sp. WAC 01529 TaxID=2203205 RepID=UPI000F6E7032|nr:AfsR/SARP family transcriptional regulator [Streptomyces sp. WAC 01529]AZM55060.1 hypothetical protein DMA15_22880 [Streptomyces sp. WAC 01529]